MITSASTKEHFKKWLFVYLISLLLIIIVVLLIVKITQHDHDSKRIDTNRDNISNIVKFLNNKFGDEVPKLIRSESPREESKPSWCTFSKLLRDKGVGLRNSGGDTSTLSVYKGTFPKLYKVFSDKKNIIGDGVPKIMKTKRTIIQKELN